MGHLPLPLFALNPFTRFSRPWAIAEKDGRGNPPIMTLEEPLRIMPGVPVGGMHGWSVPIILVMEAAAASAAA